MWTLGPTSTRWAFCSTSSLPENSLSLRTNYGPRVPGTASKVEGRGAASAQQQAQQFGKGAAKSAENRRTDPLELRNQLEGDLDAITMKALEKDRARRYGTPSELATDVGRYLRDEPVVARPPSTAYRVGKYIKRHRLGVGVASGLIALLVAFAVVMGVEAKRIAVERDRANRERVASDKVSAFLANMLINLKPEALGNALWKD